MFALCAAVEALELVLDGVVYALVVAGFEVQAMEVFARAPVAAVQSVVAAETNGGGDGMGLMGGELHHDALGHAGSNVFEKCAA